jgi:hypothetical protein
VTVEQQRQSDENLLFDELAASVPLADPAVVAVVRELTAEIGRMRSPADHVNPGSPAVEALTDLVLNQAAELQIMHERLQRVRALVEFTRWAATSADGAADPKIRTSDIMHAIAGPIASRSVST